MLDARNDVGSEDTSTDEEASLARLCRRVAHTIPLFLVAFGLTLLGWQCSKPTELGQLITEPFPSLKLEFQKPERDQLSMNAG